MRTFTTKRCSSDATENCSADVTQGASGKNVANVTNMSFENAVSLVARNNDEIAVDAGEDDSMSESMVNLALFFDEFKSLLYMLVLFAVYASNTLFFILISFVPYRHHLLASV